MNPSAVENHPRMHAPSSSRSIVAVSLFLGAVGGSLELVIFLLKCTYFDPRHYNVSRQFTWMFPAAGLLIVGTIGILLAALARMWPQVVTRRIVLFALAFPSFLGVAFRFPISTSACLIVSAGMAIRLASGFTARQVALERIAWPGVMGLVLLFGSMAIAPNVSCLFERRRAQTSTSKPTRSARNVLLVVLDTFRADRLVVSDDPGGLTSNLARYAKRGTRFERAYSTAPWTAPSHASMFTGRWPHELAIGWNHPLEKGPVTLAEALDSEGLRTAGFVANTTYCSYETGLDRGFRHYEDYDVNLGSILLCSSVTQRLLNFIHHHPALEQRLPSLDFAKSTRKDASRIRRDFTSWLNQQRGEPFFAFLNMFDVHHPYLSPEDRSTSKSDRRILKTWWDIDKSELPERDLELARAAYDDCVRYTDRELGLLLDDLDRRGLLNETLVVITADHGEHLGERNLYGHGCSLYDAEVHVPLLLIGEGVVPAGFVVAEPVSLRDLPATVVDLLGVGGRPPFPGQSLAATWSRDGSPSASPVLAEIDGPPEVDPNSGRSPVQKGPMRSLISRSLRYIRNGDGVEELYSIGADAADNTNHAADPAFASRIEQFRRFLPEGPDSAPGRDRMLGLRGARFGTRAGL